MKGYAICQECKGVMVVERSMAARVWEGVHCNFVRHVETKGVILETLAEELTEKEIKEALEFLGNGEQNRRL